MKENTLNISIVPLNSKRVTEALSLNCEVNMVWLSCVKETLFLLYSVTKQSQVGGMTGYLFVNKV